ncbi:MAG: hypothetical protein CMP10_19450 [Zetaproteobacteria bacterium]|nr:hypothetical protein [Pseudobdellovibrionaceae bacterium]
MKQKNLLTITRALGISLFLGFGSLSAIAEEAPILSCQFEGKWAAGCANFDGEWTEGQKQDYCQSQSKEDIPPSYNTEVCAVVDYDTRCVISNEGESNGVVAMYTNGMPQFVCTTFLKGVYEKRPEGGWAE